MPDTDPTDPPPLTPLPADLPALLAADRARRVQLCETAIAHLLTLHRCRLVSTQLITDGQAGPLEIRVIPTD